MKEQSMEGGGGTETRARTTVRSCLRPGWTLGQRGGEGRREKGNPAASEVESGCEAGGRWAPRVK